MKIIQNLSLWVLIVLSIFCGCVAAENTEADIAVTQTDSLNKIDEMAQLTYQINEMLHFPINDKNSGFEVIVVRSPNELKLLYVDVVPENANIYDDAYFENHTLVIVNYVCGHVQFTMLPGELTTDGEGIYHLAVNGYSPEAVSTAISYHQFVLETNFVLERNSTVEIGYTDHRLTSDAFYSMFPNLS